MLTPNDDINLHKRFDLSGRLAFVSGSARGIGRAIALGLAEYGAAVVVHGHKDSAPLQSALQAARGLSPKSGAVFGDLTRPETPAEILAQIKARFGRLPDIIVANASLQEKKDWQDFTAADAQAHLQVNFTATLALAQGCAESMKAQNWGRILTIGSVQEFRPHPQMAVYAATKSAQENLVRNLARQLAQFGITVNNLAPGVFFTDRNKDALGNPEYAKRVTDCIPSRTYGEPADAAGAALLLCSDAGRYITGANLVVDGGLRLPGQ